jgi:acetate kinase
MHSVNVLVFNPGSNSLKVELVSAEARAEHVVDGASLLSGLLEPVHGEATLTIGDRVEQVAVRDYAHATEIITQRISTQLPQPVELMAFRVVHGGAQFTKPTPITEDFLAALEPLNELAPLHNPNCIAVIRAARAAFSRYIAAVALFDTAFHSTIPEHAYTYALPYDLAFRHGIRRYGFHGISHHYLTLRYAELTRTPVARTNIVSLHLGGGASAAAIQNGRSIDTSMGFTPLEGLVMGTRCGDLDPAVVGFLARREKASVDTVEQWLTKKSGLLGMSGRSQDTRVLTAEESNDPRVKLALDVFSYRAKKYVAAYLGVLEQAGAVVFAGGIGENTPSVRSRICRGLEHLGILFDSERNAEVIDRPGRITRQDSPIHAWVIPTQEALMMAHLAVCRMRKQ